MEISTALRDLSNIELIDESIADEVCDVVQQSASIAQDGFSEVKAEAINEPAMEFSEEVVHEGSKIERSVNESISKIIIYMYVVCVSNLGII